MKTTRDINHSMRVFYLPFAYLYGVRMRSVGKFVSWCFLLLVPSLTYFYLSLPAETLLCKAILSYFLLWCSRVGWRKSCHLQKMNPLQPHGPKNSFWDPPDTAGAVYVPGHPCRDCPKELHCTAICEKRAAYWDERMEPLRRMMGVDGV